MALVVRTSTGTEYTVEEKVAQQMVGLKDLVTSTTEDGKTTNKLDEKVKDAAFAKALEFCTHHKDDPSPIERPEEEDSPRTLDMTPWDEKFINMDTQLLVDVVNLANLLKIDRMVTVACMRIADMVRDKSAEQIREMFGVAEDFTEEEREQIRKENEWQEVRSE
ncbi:hypothetical protein GGI15_004476 [Coemansia interrupta]|uniref:E3 ubiquitin ligase complex SCF subunit n=1 Tax=Coemansia interrupta TaxID=1126814 RepID=A0A9W8HA93_9FUNG|nr:hypothetical protein GGI15_004476 [Coemansia interrupta]